MSATYHTVLHRPSQRHECVLHTTPERLINYSGWEQCVRVEMGPQDGRAEMLCFPFFRLLCVFSPSTLKKWGTWDCISLNLIVNYLVFFFLLSPTPPSLLDELSNKFQFPEIPFLVKLFIFLQRVLLHASKVCNFSTLVPLCFTVLRTFLSSSPFTRTSEKSKMSCFLVCFF